MCTHYTQVRLTVPGPRGAQSMHRGCELRVDGLCFADGVGDVQQSRLCCSHVPQYECMGVGVETGYVLSLQLLT